MHSDPFKKALGQVLNPESEEMNARFTGFKGQCLCGMGPGTLGTGKAGVYLVLPLDLGNPFGDG